MSPSTQIHDVLGIGFGPSNLALAAALQEQCGSLAPTALFLEQKSSFGWHPHMLLPGMEMQISFLKDLATQRNPSSPYTFLSYLKEMGRLAAFANLRHFYPSRIEFNDYLSWVAAKLQRYARYGHRVTSVLPHGSAPHRLIEVTAQDLAAGTTRRFLARNIVVAPGGTPAIPFPVSARHDSARVWHSGEHLDKLGRLNAGFDTPMHVAVVGRGQSAAEIACDLHRSFAQATVTCIFRGIGFKPADDSEFVNEIFDSTFIDFIHEVEPPLRRQVIAEHYNTNYSVVDSELIRELYRICYDERVRGLRRLRIKNLCSVESVEELDEAVVITTRQSPSSACEMTTVDAVVLATGYEYPNPPKVLDGLASHFIATGNGSGVVVDRDYRIATDDRLQAGVFVQGCNEATHGLSDTLLSVLSIRAGEILQRLLANLEPTRQRPPAAAPEFEVACAERIE